MNKVVHNLKIKERFLNRIIMGEKKSEVRINDRDFQKGDLIHFKIDIREKVSAAKITHEPTFSYVITHVFQEQGFGLEPGYCILSIKKED